MRPKRNIQWTAPPEQLKEDRLHKAEIRNLPVFNAEPRMKEEARAAWDEIELGSAVRFKHPCLASNKIGYPLGVLERQFFETVPAGWRGFTENTFAIYLGMTSVKMRRHGTFDTVERAFRTVLVGQNKYIIEDPNIIGTV